MDVQAEVHINEDINGTIAHCNGLLDEKDKEIAKLKRRLEIFERQVICVNNIFNPDQKSRLMNPKSRSPWSKESIQDSIQTYRQYGFIMS